MVGCPQKHKYGENTGLYWLITHRQDVYDINLVLFACVYFVALKSSLAKKIQFTSYFNLYYLLNIVSYFSKDFEQFKVFGSWHANTLRRSLRKVLL